jgi:hypothetical protein
MENEKIAKIIKNFSFEYEVISIHTVSTSYSMYLAEFMAIADFFMSF